MKVEIDADDLCWLKKRNKHLEADIANLHRQLYAAYACNVDYQVECDWKKLKEERDFWKEKCESACRWYDAVLAEARAAHNHRMVSAETRFNDWQTEASNIGLNR